MTTVTTPCGCGPGGAPSSVVVTIPTAVYTSSCATCAAIGVPGGTGAYTVPSEPKFTGAAGKKVGAAGGAVLGIVGAIVALL